MSNTLSIRKESLMNIVSTILSNKGVQEPLNFDHIKNIILNNMSDSTLENVVELMLTKEHYELVYPNDLVKVRPPSYHEGSKYEKDILKDMGLLPEDNMVYAKVISDNSWSTNNKYNPLYSQLKIEYLYHDENRNLAFIEDTTSPFELKKLKTRELNKLVKSMENQLKNKKDAKIINGTDQITL